MKTYRVRVCPLSPVPADEGLVLEVIIAARDMKQVYARIKRYVPNAIILDCFPKEASA